MNTHLGMSQGFSCADGAVVFVPAALGVSSVETDQTCWLGCSSEKSFPSIETAVLAPAQEDY